MVEIGKINRLSIKGTQVYGVHLNGGSSGDILLRDKNAAHKYKPNEEIEVFVYVDREQRLMATRQQPLALVGEFSFLKVVTNSKAGAFLDWGLENDLLVPKSEQEQGMREGNGYVVYLFLSEKTNRITASSKLEQFLGQQPPEYKEEEEVDLLIYAKTALGYSAIVNNSHVGMLYKNEVFQNLAIGQRLTGYINKVREDLKIDLRLQKSGYRKVDDISQTILTIITDNGGSVAVTDKSPPEEIYDLFGVSKKVFKKAIGGLYKKRLITIDKDCIKIASIT